MVRREVLGLGPSGHGDPRPGWHGPGVGATPVYVVEDDGDEVVTSLPEGAEIGFVEGGWPKPDGKHPRAGRPWDPPCADWSTPADGNGARRPADRHLPPCPST